MELLLFLILLWIFVWIGFKNYQAQQREARLRAIEIAQIDSMDGITFEHYVAWLMQQRGWEHVQLTKGSGDFGADIIATKDGVRYAIQVKRHSGKISRRAVSDAVAAKSYYGCDAAMVITNSYFSQPALDFAKSIGCAVVDRSTLAEWIFEVQSANREPNER